MKLLLDLLFIFMKIGCFTIGGGMASLPLVQQMLVNKGYMSVAESTNMVAISEMTPGPFFINSATFSGMRIAGFWGAFVATLGVFLPSLIICIVVYRFFFRMNTKPTVRSVLSGIKPVVISLILNGAISIFLASVFPESSFASIDIPVLCIAIVMSVIMLKTKISPPLLILISGVFGAIFLRS